MTLTLVTALIFVDYDGVLQTPALSNFKDFEFLPRFEGVLRDFPQAGVVIASTHRYGFSLDTLRRIYSPDIRPRVIGMTPDLANGRADSGRYAEALAYLEESGQQELPWISLDDEAHLFPANCPNLLRTSRYEGFSEDIEQKLRAWLELHAR